MNNKDRLQNVTNLLLENNLYNLRVESSLTSIREDLEVLNIIKKFFFVEAYSDKRLNADFCKITSIEDKETNMDNSALSFIDGHSLKILKKWLRGVKNDK